MAKKTTKQRKKTAVNVSISKSKLSNAAFKLMPRILIVVGLILVVWGIWEIIKEKRSEENGTGEIIITEDNSDNKQEGDISKNDEDPDDELEESEVEDEEGEILEGINTNNSEIAGIAEARDKGLQKSKINQERIKATGKWYATDYQKGDIVDINYTIRLGDTLWEIAEGYYGNPEAWVFILNANQSKVGYLPNGERALIFPNDMIMIPAK
jgi:hypothetical protein